MQVDEEIITEPSKVMKLTVVIPTRNRKKILKRLLDRLVVDPMVHEIIVVDDMSSDGTKALVLNYLKHHDKLRYILGGGKGQVLAIKKGVDNSNGDIICFLDDDIIPAEGWIKPVKKQFEQGCDIVQVKIINQGEKNINRDQKIKFKWNMSCNVHWNWGISQVELPICQEAGVFIRRGILEKVPFYDPNLIGDGWGESISFALRAKEKGYKILFEPKSVLYHFHYAFGGSSKDRFNTKKEWKQSPEFFEGKYYNLIYLQKTFKEKYLFPTIFYWIIIAAMASMLYKCPKCFVFALKGMKNAYFTSFDTYL